MARVEVTADSVTVSLSMLEKIAALHGNLAIPRSAVTSARVVPDGLAELKGVRAPGTGIPGAIRIGTIRSRRSTTFAVCHGKRPAVVIELTRARYDRIVVTVDDPGSTVRSLS